MKHNLRICHSEPFDFSQDKLREESLRLFQSSFAIAQGDAK